MYLPWWSVSSRPFIHFVLSCFIETWESFMKICILQIFSSSLLSSFSYHCLSENLGLTFNLVGWSLVSQFFLSWFVLSVSFPVSLCLTQGHKYFPHIFFLNIIYLHFMFRIMIQFELSFCCMTRLQLSLFFFS